MNTAPALGFDDEDAAENAVINRLSGNWSRRATVRKPELEFDDSDPGRPEYPSALIPFAQDPRFQRLPEHVKDTVSAWAFVSFNKSICDIEQRIVNPGFQLLAEDRFETGLGQPLTIAATQAQVDEQYHTLLHRNASWATRRRRRATLSDSSLPLSHKVASQDIRIAAAGDSREEALVRLAFTTVAEVSINNYLEQIADDTEIQPFNAATAKIHTRDEHCHASIAGELARIVHSGLNARDRQTFTDELAHAVKGFSATDARTWLSICEAAGVPEGAAMMADVTAARPGRPIDMSLVRDLCRQIGIEADVFDPTV